MEKSVRLYSLSTCSHCKATKKLLGKCQVQYEFTDVDLLDKEERQAILEDIKAFNPACSFPTVVIGDKVIVGYKEEQILEALGLEMEKPGLLKRIFKELTSLS
jgi:glutaredoxin-like protein NrdH